MKKEPLDLEKLRSLKGEGMESTVGEYAPRELWDALDEIERLRSDTMKKEIKLLKQLNRSLELICADDPNSWSDPVFGVMEDSKAAASRHDVAKIVLINRIIDLADKAPPTRKP